jgi:hypothetical protein
VPQLSGVQDGRYGQLVAGAVRFEVHQVGQLQGEHAGEGVHDDVVFGPVEHRGERDLVGVFDLPEPELNLWLGAVAGDDVGDGPMLVVGEQDPFAEYLVFQGSSFLWVQPPPVGQ